jgi:hypothetical protein
MACVRWRNSSAAIDNDQTEATVLVLDCLVFVE